MKENHLPTGHIYDCSADMRLIKHTLYAKEYLKLPQSK